MKNFVITADSNSDLLPQYIQENKIGIIPHYYNIDGIVYGDEINLTPKEFYDKMRGGVMPTTMASNPLVIYNTFTSYIKEGYDVLHISFSSALSGGHNNVASGANEVMEENPGSKIIVIDSLNVSIGEGLLVMEAVKLRKEGLSIDEVATIIEEKKSKIAVQFTVDDLFHLQRGGRISKMTAIVGSMINVKPILVVNETGNLISNGTVRGRKKALATIADNALKQLEGVSAEGGTIGIVHGDAPEDAAYVERILREALPNYEIIINTVSPSIGSHSGPGAIGICFFRA